MSKAATKRRQDQGQAPSKTEVARFNKTKKKTPPQAQKSRQILPPWALRVLISAGLLLAANIATGLIVIQFPYTVANVLWLPYFLIFLAAAIIHALALAWAHMRGTAANARNLAIHSWRTVIPPALMLTTLAEAMITMLSVALAAVWIAALACTPLWRRKD
ncbi:hypothetical protein [Nesterenkonia rhizosphaerae]|uniref:Uncharacterized protein n=1 Tax=Nesterenkonia rhizosphaerae TaxID=1348272 RepID=A0ABP9G1I9_9MICC